TVVPMECGDLPARSAIRVPLTRVKGLTERIKTRLVAERQHQEFASLSGFYRRVVPAPEEMEAMIRVGAFDPFGKTRTAQFWEAQHLYRAFGEEGRGQRSEVRSQKSEDRLLTRAALPGLQSRD